ncbi:MAG: replication initiator protein A [Acidobacteriaceae bacterium]|nr:replication initiator protein A [Acidobacteriaceae bacterium]
MEQVASILQILAKTRGIEIDRRTSERKIECIQAVRAQREHRSQELVYAARPFVLSGLPLKRPPVGVLLHRRWNGRYFLEVQGHPDFGLPFGQDRLLIIWIASLAVRRQTRFIEFRAGSEILEEFGLPRNGFHYRRIVEAFQRIFSCTIFFGTDNGRQPMFDRARFCFFDRMRVWYSPDNRDGSLNRVELTEHFWQEIKAHPIPAEREVVRALANTPGCLDLYIWLVWRCHAARSIEHIPLLSENGLIAQLGAKSMRGLAILSER